MTTTTSILRTLALGAGVLGLSACATVTRGTKETLVIESTPPGAAVTLNNASLEEPITCTTPCEMKISRKRPYDVTFAMDGYEPLETEVLTPSSGAGNGAMAGNLIAGGLIGVAIDAGNGSTHKFDPNPLVVTLTPLAAPAALETAAPRAADTDTDEDAFDPLMDEPAS